MSFNLSIIDQFVALIGGAIIKREQLLTFNLCQLLIYFKEVYEI